MRFTHAVSEPKGSLPAAAAASAVVINMRVTDGGEREMAIQISHRIRNLFARNGPARDDARSPSQMIPQAGRNFRPIDADPSD